MPLFYIGAMENFWTLSNNSQGSQMLLLKIKALSIFANFEVSLGGFLVGFIFYLSIWIIPKRNYPGSTHFPFLANALRLNQPEKLYYLLWRCWAHTTGTPSANQLQHPMEQPPQSALAKGTIWPFPRRRCRSTWPRDVEGPLLQQRGGHQHLVSAEPSV